MSLTLRAKHAGRGQTATVDMVRLASSSTMAQGVACIDLERQIPFLRRKRRKNAEKKAAEATEDDLEVQGMLNAADEKENGKSSPHGFFRP